MTRRWLSLALVLALLSSVFSMGAAAQGVVRKGLPVLTFVPAVTTIAAEAEGGDFTRKLLGEFKVDGRALSDDDKDALSQGITESSLIYEETPSTNDLLKSIEIDGNELYASFKSPTAANGKAELPIRFVDGLKLSGYVTTSLSGQQIAMVSVYTAVSTVELDTREHTFGGKVASKTLTATVNAGRKTAADIEYVWSSSAPEIVKAEEVPGKPNQQTITPLAEGKATITVTAKDAAGTASATCEVTVNRGPSTGVTITGFDENTRVGERVQLKAEISGEANTDTVKSWSSSDEEVAIIDNDGVLTAISEGVTVITVTTNYGHTHAPSVQVYASKGKVSNPEYSLSGELSKPGAAVEIETTTVGAKVYYTMTDNGAAPVALTAANAVAVGTLYAGPIALPENKTYKFNAIAVKDSTASDQVAQQYSVDIAVTDFTLDKTAVTVNGKAEVVLTATVIPASANVKGIEWTPNAAGDNVSRVEPSADGKTFRLTTTGVSGVVTAEATVSYGNEEPATKKAASCKITVKQVTETGVSASPATLSIPAGRTAVLKAVVAPANATYEKVNFYFNKDSKAIAVAGATDGFVANQDSIVIEAKETGEGMTETITLVTTNGLRSTCKVTVTAASIKVATPVFDVADGTVFTKTGVSDRTVHLSSATKGADFAYTINGVSHTGSTIEIPENTTAVVVAWATKDGLQKSDTVTATFTSATAVTGVELVDTIAITGKDTHVITAVLDPPTAKNKALTWKSNDASVATVSQMAGAGNELKAIVTAVKPGTTTISATSADGGFKDSVTVTVNPVNKMDSVQIHGSTGNVSGKTLTLNKGEAEQLTVKGFNGSDEVKPFGTPSWTSSDNTVATVSNTGRVVVLAAADAAKTANITVKLGDMTDTVTIQPGAKPAKVAELKFDVAEGMYTSEITVKAATATDGASIYYTLDGTDPKATSTPFPSAGIKLSTKTTLRAVALKASLDPANVKAEYDFNIAVNEVKMEKTSLTLTKGATAQMKATVTPDNATNATIDWSVEPSSVASIDSASGVLTAKGVGEATVTATVGGKTATCAVKIVDVAATAISLAPSTASLTIGESKQLTALMQPDGLVGKTISWTTSDEFIASVSDGGRVTARKAGTATITATVDGVHATAVITVEDAPATIPAEPKKEVTFAPVIKEFTVIEGGSLSKVLGKLQPGDGETMDQIWYYCNIAFENFDAPDISSGAAKPTFDVARDGTVTLNISNVGDATTTAFSYEWSLTAKKISGFNPSVSDPLMNSGRKISGNKLNVVIKPTAINFNEETVDHIEMMGSDKKEVVVGKIDNYAAFNAARVDVKQTVTGANKGATATIATDGTVTVTLSGLMRGEYEIVVKLTAKDCSDVKTGFKVTVTQSPARKIVVDTETKVILSSYRSRPVYIVNLTDKNITFSVPNYTVTGWKSDQPKLMSINSDGVATLKKGGTTRITVSARLSDGTILSHYVVIRKVATSLELQYKQGKNWVTFGETPVNLIQGGSKLPVRVVAYPSGSVIFATQKWKGDCSAATYKSNYISGHSVGETTFQYVLDNGVSATAKINVNPTPKIEVETETKVIMSSYRNRPVYIVNLTDKNIAFSVPDYTVTGWKSSQPRIMSINSDGVATLKKGGTTLIKVYARLSDGTILSHYVVIRKVATTLKLQYKQGKNWVTFDDTPVNLIKDSKLQVRVVAYPSGAVIFATKKWEGDNSSATYKSNYISGRSVGETTFQYVLDNGFKATAKINVVSKGVKGFNEPLEPLPTEPAAIEPLPTEPAAIEPAPTESAPTEPTPTEPAPSEPDPTEPVLLEPPQPEDTANVMEEVEEIEKTEAVETK